MKKISLLCLIGIIGATSAADAAYSDSAFRKEVRDGLDMVSARITIKEYEEPAPGELGLDVYRTATAGANKDNKLFIPTTMYVRAGAGLNLGFATDGAMFNGKKHSADGGYATRVGLGLNLSSYVRTEFDFQYDNLRFSDLKNHNATYQMANAMLYFDFARRYVQTGDITRMRWFVPFMGIGAGVGMYQFQGADGADGFVIGAPMAEVGFNIMLTRLIGLDIAYQYRMMIGNGYGWGTRSGGVDNVSNVMATFRANF